MMKLFIFCLLVSPFAHANKLDTDGILRTDAGSIVTLNQTDAVTACPLGTHLGSIRDFATDAESRGAVGVVETADLSPSDSKRAYQIHAINLDGNAEEFYYISSGYKTSSSDIGRKDLNWWSSSTDTDYEPYAYYFSGVGIIGPAMKTAPEGVRCFKN